VPRLLVSEQAEDDLHAITAYIAEQSGKLRAEQVSARLRKTMDNLAFMPGIGGHRQVSRYGFSRVSDSAVARHL
jgi:plasmid stabilization system protein ParE